MTERTRTFDPDDAEHRAWRARINELVYQHLNTEIINLDQHDIHIDVRQPQERLAS